MVLRLEGRVDNYLSMGMHRYTMLYTLYILRYGNQSIRQDDGLLYATEVQAIN